MTDRRIVVSVDDELMAQLDKYAENFEGNRSMAVRQALRVALLPRVDLVRHAAPPTAVEF